MRIFLFILTSVLLSNCSNTEIKPAKNGLKQDSEKISVKQSQLIFHKVKVFPNQTELSLAIIDSDSITFFGVKRLNDTLLKTSNFNRIFEIGSISKVFTSTILANLVLQNKIKLNTPIQQIVDYNIPIGKEISLIELANHTSGLPKQPTNMSWLNTDYDNPFQNYNEQKLIDYITTQAEFNQKPGSKYEYSNLGAGLLGYLLTKKSKSTYEDLLQEYVFRKYQMTNSTTNKNKIVSQLINGLTPKGETSSNWDFDVLVGAGGILSSVNDLSKFAQAHFNKENLELALTRKPTFAINDTIRLGLAWHLPKLKNGNELVFHNGGTGGYSSSMILDIENKKGVVILSNISTYHEERNRVDELCFELLESIKTK